MMQMICLRTGFFLKKIGFQNSRILLKSFLQPGWTLENAAFALMLQEVVKVGFFFIQSESIAAASAREVFLVLIAALRVTPPDGCYATYFNLLKVSMWVQQNCVCVCVFDLFTKQESKFTCPSKVTILSRA